MCLPENFLYCWCIKPSREKRLRVKALNRVFKETSIDHILKQLRVLKGSIKADELKALKKKHALINYSDLDETPKG